jgi:aminoglycoside 2'-N-acetyltransferase I
VSENPVEPDRVVIRRARTTELSTADLAGIRALLDAAFAPEDPVFPESDWLHALGGLHFLAVLDGRTVGHASVVERELHVAGRPMRTGYVEAVATSPQMQGRGVGTLVMRAANDHIRSTYELGALGTGEQGFYARLGWRAWQGPLFVRSPEGELRTPEEDGGIMVLTTPSTGQLDLSAPLSCDWRAGDVW